MVIALDDWVGKILDGKYRIIRLIGLGGMGAVFEAEHVVLNRRAAVKILSPDHQVSDNAVERFLREGRAAAAIDHPNIVDVQDFGKEPDGTVFIVMELLRGDTLQSVLDYRGALPIEHAVAICLQVLSALDAAHAKGIVHRDLKPENIYLTAATGRGEHVKIMDFGVAKYTSSDAEALRLTATGTVLGTPYYLAPEQASGGKDIDERIDLWSTGVVLYEMLTGKLPFDGDNYNEILSRILMKSFESVQTLRPDVPRGLIQVVEKALAKDRNRRFQSAAEMIEALMPFSKEPATAMSSGAMRALRDSLAPPPAFTSRATSGRISSRGSNPDMQETVGYDALEVTDSQPIRPRSRLWSLRGAGAAGAALAVLVVVIAVLLEKVTTEAPEVLTRSITIATPSAAPQKASASSSDEEKSQSTLQHRPAETVTVEITGLPTGADLTLDGEPVATPLTVARSDTPKTLRVTAPGFAPLERPIVPSRDQVFSVEMKKTRIESAKKKRHTKKRVKRKNEKGWRANPFEK